MSFVKNPILLPLQKLIGLAPSPTPLVLDEGNVSLTLPIVPDITRRSETLAQTTGWYIGILENVHSAADTEQSAIDPWNAGPDAVPPYPEVMRPGEWDMWLAGVSGRRSSGTGTLDEGHLILNVDPPNQGWGRDDAGAPVVETPNALIARFDAIATESQLSTDPLLTEQGLGYQPLRMRMPFGSTLAFNSTAGTAAATFQLQIFFGLFPAGLGQDVAF